MSWWKATQNATNCTADGSRWGEKGRGQGGKAWPLMSPSLFLKAYYRQSPWESITVHYLKRACVKLTDLDFIKHWESTYECQTWDIKINKTQSLKPSGSLASVGRQLSTQTSWYSTTNTLPGRRARALGAQPAPSLALPGDSVGLHPGGDTTSIDALGVCKFARHRKTRKRTCQREETAFAKTEEWGVLCWDTEYSSGWGSGGHINEGELGNGMRGSVAQFSSMRFMLKELWSSVQV